MPRRLGKLESHGFGFRGCRVERGLGTEPRVGTWLLPVLSADFAWLSPSVSVKQQLEYVRVLGTECLYSYIKKLKAEFAYLFSRLYEEDLFWAPFGRLGARLRHEDPVRGCGCGCGCSFGCRV